MIEHVLVPGVLMETKGRSCVLWHNMPGSIRSSEFNIPREGAFILILGDGKQDRQWRDPLYWLVLCEGRVYFWAHGDTKFATRVT